MTFFLDFLMKLLSLTLTQKNGLLSKTWVKEEDYMLPVLSILLLQNNFAITCRMFENEGQPEKAYKTLKIGGLDHLFGISAIYTWERFFGYTFCEKFLIFIAKNNRVKRKQKIAYFCLFFHFYLILLWILVPCIQY